MGKGFAGFNAQSPSERWDGDCALSKRTLLPLRFEGPAMNILG
jgi:hypothetical protein